MGHVERIIPDETEPGIVALHLKRYEWARQWCAGKDVLDAACGAGYGSAYLAETARRVVGVDLDAGAVEYARQRYAAPNVEFLQMDVSRLELPDATFDVVCSFETIEHVAHREGYLEGVARVLRADGVYLVSTPRGDRTVGRPDNPYHLIEFSRHDFERLLLRYFEHVELLGQHRRETRRYRFVRRLDVLGLRRRTRIFHPLGRRLLGTSPLDELRSDDLVISDENVDRARELVAVCRPPRHR